MPIGADATDDLVDTLEREPALPGWTAANVLRRLRPSTEQLTRLRDVLAHNPNPLIRWRAAHALGTHGSRANLDALLTALTHDQYGWVRYGAMRALIETAARDPELRDPIVAGVVAVLEEVRRDQWALRELERGVVFEKAAPGWADAVELVLGELWARSTTIEDQDHWRELAYEVHRAAGE